MDHMIREAAENHHPAYNDKAWEKMELQLDKHLPQKKDRKKLVFFFLLFVLLGGGLIVGIDQMTGSKKAGTDTNTVNRGQAHKTAATLPADETKTTAAQDVPSTTENNNAVAPGNATTGTRDNNTGSNVNKNNAGSTITAQGNTVKELNREGNRPETPVNYAGRTGRHKTFADLPVKHNTKKRNSNTYDPGDITLNNTNAKKNRVGNKAKMKGTIVATNGEEDIPAGEEKIGKKKRSIIGKTDQKLTATVTGAAAENEETVSATGKAKGQESTEEKISTEPKDSVEAKKDKELVKTEEKPESKPAGKKRPERKFGSNFGITVSAGPDLSFIKLNKVGKATMTYGAGLSYNFAKRFTVRAGFYFSKKIYEASPEDYHMPGVTYPYFTGVDANCKVYEIPVNISYHFWQRNKHNWFGNLGLSSYLMKTEDYTYKYKTPSGQSYNYYMGVTNENKHYFAVLNLSAGYQYQLSKRIALQAEPYFKLPLSGIGLGKIKLNSAGVLFTVTVKPFAK